MCTQCLTTRDRKVGSQHETNAPSYEGTYLVASSNVSWLCVCALFSCSKNFMIPFLCLAIYIFCYVRTSVSSFMHNINFPTCDVQFVSVADDVIGFVLLIHKRKPYGSCIILQIAGLYEIVLDLLLLRDSNLVTV